jgi:AcrR family transcriptional regulator
MTTNTIPLQSTRTLRAEPVQQRSADRITTLLDAAASLIDSSGIDGLTTSDVAVRSASSVGVIYRYFPNIQSLLRALAARNMEKFTAQVTVAMTESTTVLDALNATIDSYVELSRTEPGFRALRFGDVIDERFLQPELGNTAVLAKLFADALVTHWGFVRSAQFAFNLEVSLEVAAALLPRAFRYDRNGDAAFISAARESVAEFVTAHETVPRS